MHMLLKDRFGNTRLPTFILMISGCIIPGLVVILFIIGWTKASFEVLLEVFHLHHNLFGVFALLAAENIEFVFSVFLNEDIILIEHFDGRVNLENLPGLHVLEVDLPCLRVLCRLIELGLQVSDLMFRELLERAHHFLNPHHLLRQRLISHARVPDGLLLQGVHLVDLLPQSALEETLSLVDRLRDLAYLLDRVTDVLLRLLCDQCVLHLLLVAHFLDESGNLLHGCVHLSHDAFLTFKRPLFSPRLDRANHL